MLGLGSKEGIKHLTPYWHVYATRAKQRWLGKPLVEVLAGEYRDRCAEYYAKAIDAGLVRLNGKVTERETMLRNADVLQHIVHRHEPPITSTPVRVLHHDKDQQFIVVDKPGSIPVHPSGRYFRNSVISILQHEHGYDKLYPVNRLDRLTSGLLIFPLTSTLASTLAEEFRSGKVRKEYVARVRGEFPAGKIPCDAPLLTIDKQIGLNIVHPEGKPAKTIFERVRYDSESNSSVVICRPETGRSHQIRVHLQYLGHPIANDQEYADTRLWGEKLAKGGLAPDGKYIHEDNLVPAPDAAEVQNVVERLRQVRDERNDWNRWRDVVLTSSSNISSFDTLSFPSRPPSSTPLNTVPQLTLEEALSFLSSQQPTPSSSVTNIDNPGEPSDSEDQESKHCSTCLLPLLPDPEPEDLYIYLHAWRYETSLGAFEASWPTWTEEGWSKNGGRARS